MGRHAIDMTGWVMKDHGVKDSRVTVLKRIDDYIGSTGIHEPQWECLCDCGNEKDVRGSNLTSGLSKSCGCLQKEDRKGTNFDKTLREYDIDGNITGRVCSCCKRMLPIDNYYKDSHTADGVSNMCKYCQARSVHGRYQVYRQGAKNRNLDFELTRDEFAIITEKPCHYCGEYSDAYFDKPYSGIDRVDSSIGYVVNNVVPCCTMCNRMKLDYNINTWVEKMKQILSHLEDTNE